MTQDEPSAIMGLFEFGTAGSFIAAIYSAGSIGDPVVAAVVFVAIFFIYLERRFRLENHRLRAAFDGPEDTAAEGDVN